jgi:mRNA interferase HigB
MRVNLIKKQTVEDYVDQHPRARASFNIWLGILKFADWNAPEDIRATFSSADFLGRGTNRVIFDVGGNDYRVICKYSFGTRQVRLFICWLGSHTEYDRLNRSGEQYTVWRY